METVKNEKDQLTIQKEQAERQSICIEHTIEMDALFKLYSYRIIEHESFIQQTKARIEEFQTKWDIISNTYDNEETPF